ncbi:MAG: glycosyltransferase family 25 protein [Methylococcales bacterium]|nr:glycosyltransferase family 25 protein [Methylococcales bacterium]
MEEQTLKHIFVLNVKAFTLRRAFMERQLAKVGMAADFISDWDIEDLSPAVIAQYFTAGNTLSDGQKSCALKHVQALRNTVASGGLALILEDDALLGKDFKLGLQRALRQSGQFTGDKVIFIGSGGNFFTPKSQRRPGQYLYIGSRGRFADSYIIDSVAAQKRLDWIDTHKIAKPIDNQFEEIDRQLGITMLWLEEPVVEQGSKNGLFDSALEAAPPAWLKAMLFRWEKLKRKYIYQLWR